MTRFAVNSPEQQEEAGALLAALCPARFVIYLDGDLGAGKTTLVRGFLQGLGYKGAVKSPTYTLMEPYEIGGRRYFHFDLYRLADPEELEYLGVRDLLQSDAVMLFEWPDRGQGALPRADLVVQIAHRSDGRDITLVSANEQTEELISTLEKRMACAIERKMGESFVSG